MWARKSPELPEPPSPVTPKPSAIGAIGNPLQVVAGGPDAGREELGGTAAAAREGAVGVDPHVELDLIISGENYHRPARC